MNLLKKTFKGRNPWPTAIIAYFVVFISFIVGFIAFASRQNVELVQQDYYSEEILFQKQIDRRARAAQLRDHIFISYDQARGVLKVRMPQEQLGHGLDGRIVFYRPSDSRLDRELKLNLTREGSQEIGVGAFPKGLWKVRVNWSAAGNDYSYDETLVLGL
jgi:nitrogen fixation protein FixH